MLLTLSANCSGLLSNVGTIETTLMLGRSMAMLAVEASIWRLRGRRADPRAPWSTFRQVTEPQASDGVGPHDC